MQIIRAFSKSGLAVTAALALVLATGVSYIALTHAEAGFNVLVSVYEGDPMNNITVSGATVTLVADDASNPSNGTIGTTSGTGEVLFANVSGGSFTVQVRHPNYYNEDYRLVVSSNTQLFASLMKKNTDPGDPIPGGECTPTPPRGSPLLNIWPISQTGGNCTDYPLVSAKNTTQGTAYSQSVSAADNDVLHVRLYVHNGTLDYPDNEAINVMVKAALPAASGSITAEAWADNAQRITSSEKGGNVQVSLNNSSSTLEFVPGSVQVFSRGPVLIGGGSDSVVSSGLGLGNMRGCFDYLRFVTFDAKVVPHSIPPTTSSISITKAVRNVTRGQTVFVHQVDAYPQDQVEFSINVAVSGTVNNIVVSDQLPQLLTQVPGNLRVGNNNSSDSITAINLGTRTDTTVPITFLANVANTSQFLNQVTTLTNQVSVSSSAGSKSADAVVVVTVPVNGNLTMTKQVRNVTVAGSFSSSTSANPGDTVEYRVVLSVNNVVNNINFSDQLPDRIGFVANSLKIDGVANAANPSSILIGNRNTGNVEIIYRGIVAQSSSFPASGTTNLVNTATATSSAGTASAQATVVVTITPPAGSLSITKQVKNVTASNSFSSSTSANPGDTVEYRVVLNVTNAVNNINVTDQLPNRISFVANSLKIDGVANAANPSSILIGNRNSGQVELTYRGIVADSSSFSSGTTNLVNTATVTSSVGTSTAQATVIVTLQQNSSLTINKQVRNVTDSNSFSSSTQAQPGDVVEYRVVLNVSNAVNNINISDQLPNRITFVSNSLKIDGVSNAASPSSILIGNRSTSQVEILYRGTVANSSNFSNGTTNLVNTATVTSSVGTSSASATVIVNVQNQQNPFINITKQVRNLDTGNSFSNSTDASSDQTVQFRIQITNSGNATLNNVRVFDDLPNRLSFVNGSFRVNGSNVNPGTFFGNSYTLGNLTPGQTATVIFDADTNSVTQNQTVTNTATAFADNVNSVSASADVRLVAIGGANIDIRLSKRAFNNTLGQDATVVTARKGDLITYTLTVQNFGTGTANGFVIDDDIADVLQLAELVDQGGGTLNFGSNSLRWAAMDIAAGAKVEKTFSVRVRNVFPSNTDFVMTNVYGNTININVTRPMVAPATGAGTTAGIALAGAVTALAFFIKTKKFAMLVPVFKALKLTK